MARRQEALRLAGNLASIAEYQAARARGMPLEPLPYLLVVVDEFGELLVAKPEFLDTFLTVARLGRSLGVHLLLATQRLDEGRIRGLEPHLRYRICLRTFTATESRAVLDSADAYELPPIPGLGYLAVDSDKARFKAALCGLVQQFRGLRRARRAGGGPGAAAERSAAPAEPVRPRAHRRPGPRRAAPRPTTCRCWSAWQARPARGGRARCGCEPLPAALTLGALQTAGRAARSDGTAGGGCAVGLADLPERQGQQAVRYDPGGAGGNLGLAGAPRSGKSTFLQALVLALAAEAGAGRRQFYCLDLGGGGLFELAALPHVGAVVGRGEAEAAARLLRDLRALLDERASLRRSRADERAWPEVFLVVDNAGQLRQTAPDLEFDLAELATAGLPFGLHVLLSANRWLDIRPQLLDALGTRWEFHLADPAESLSGRAAAARVAGGPARPRAHPGRAPVPGGPARAVRRAGARWPGRGGVGAGEPGRATPGRPTIAPLPPRVTSAEVAVLARAAGSPPPSAGGRLPARR